MDWEFGECGRLGGGEGKSNPMNRDASKGKGQSAKLWNPDGVGIAVLIRGWEFWEFGRFMVMILGSAVISDWL